MRLLQWHHALPSASLSCSPELRSHKSQQREAKVSAECHDDALGRGMEKIRVRHWGCSNQRHSETSLPRKANAQHFPHAEFYMSRHPVEAMNRLRMLPNSD
mmetsp:Transcript_22021/g.58273  ORF Transcript_22021/g.58273 Transcript_22021/m.58273 type:complete len:101 (-) Transcript_22021:293-595(-)